MIIISAFILLLLALGLSLAAIGLVVQLVAAVVTGTVVGGIARLIVPGTQSMGILWTCILGVAGSLLANVVLAVVGVEVGLIGSAVGALVGAVAILLVIVQARASGIICIAAAVLTLAMSGCRTTPDDTPDRQETVAVARTVGKVIGTPVVFVFGVVTWPVGLAGGTAAVLAGDEFAIDEFAIPMLGWPFTIVVIYWTDAL